MVMWVCLRYLWPSVSSLTSSRGHTSASICTTSLVDSVSQEILIRTPDILCWGGGHECQGTRLEWNLGMELRLLQCMYGCNNHKLRGPCSLLSSPPPYTHYPPCSICGRTYPHIHCSCIYEESAAGPALFGAHHPGSSHLHSTCQGRVHSLLHREASRESETKA